MILEFTATDVVPEKRAMLQSLGIPPDVTVAAHIEELYAEGLQLLEETATPVGIVAEISIDEFEKVYDGEGLNDVDSVVGDVFPKAERLALFAVTSADRRRLAAAALCFLASALAASARSPALRRISRIRLVRFSVCSASLVRLALPGAM